MTKDVDIIIRGENKERNEQIAYAVYRYLSAQGFVGTRLSRFMLKAEKEPHISELTSVDSIDRSGEIFITRENIHTDS